MGRSLNAEGLLGEYYVLDYGGWQDSDLSKAGAISAAIVAASLNGGGRVILPPRQVDIASTILLPDDVELVIPAGCVLRLVDGSNCDMIANADPIGGNNRVRIRLEGIVDGNRANQAAPSNGINLQNVADPVIVGGGIVRSCRTDGLVLSSCTRPVVDVVSTDNGSHGIRLVDVVRGTHAPHNKRN